MFKYITRNKRIPNKIDNRKIQDLEEYWNSEDYGDEEWKFRYFKLKLAYFSNVSDKNLYKQIFDHTLEILANKLIKTTNKEKN